MSADLTLTEADVLALGYEAARQLLNGEWLALHRMIATFGLFVIADRDGYRTRYCYEDPMEAMRDFAGWNGTGDPPGNWVKQKPQERLNPRWLAEARDEMRDA